MKRLILLIFISVLSLSGIELSAQTIDFKCDSNYNLITDYDFPNKKVDSLLNQIDFSKEDFEFRIWNGGTGLGGIFNTVFIMRHFPEDDLWEAFYYDLTKPDDYSDLSDGVIYYNSKKLKEIWELFLSKEVLLISNPIIIRTIKKKGLSVVRYVSDCHEGITVELITKNCMHVCSFNLCSIYYDENFKNSPEYIRFNNILDIEDKVLKHEY